MQSPFLHIPGTPLDPIMALFEAYNHDSRPEKLNLVVGVYTDENGSIPILDSVRSAEQEWFAQGKPKNYRPIEGTPGFRRSVQDLLFGEDSEVITDQRAATLQSVGGTGGLKIGADLLKKVLPDAVVAVSDPSWENHRALFEAAGFKVVSYPYHDPQSHGVRFDSMCAFLRTLPAGSIVVLHACCHNPTGSDLSPDQWRMLVDLTGENDLFPFIDIAYQGFGRGLAEDALAVRLFAQAHRDFLIASSFSKSFSLYGERIGAATIVCGDPAVVSRVEGLAKRLVRTNYSNPPTHGAAIVETVLCTPSLRSLWESELGHMRTRIRRMREQLADALDRNDLGGSFQFIKAQNGMFSYSGLSAEHAKTLRDDFGIYVLDTGRICVAALNDGNLDRVVRAITHVVKR